MDVGNELRHGAGYESLKKLDSLLSQYLPILGHIRVDAVQVVVHLGASYQYQPYFVPHGR
jgi:hypothetical protein